jgi:hypothetical protein
MPRRVPLLAAVLALSVSACISSSSQNGTPIGIITMNARTKGAGYTTSPIANFYSASSITFASAGAATDSCQQAAYSSVPGTSTAQALGAGTGVAYAVSGRSDTLRKVSATNPTYLSTLPSGLAFTPGDSVTITIAGDRAGLYATSFAGKTAEPFPPSAIAVPASGQALPVTWTIPNDLNSAMIVSLRYNDGTSGAGLNAQIFCDFHDDGAGTIPANLAALWAASSQRSVFMQRLRTVVWLDPSTSQYVNLISTFEQPTPVSP